MTGVRVSCFSTLDLGCFRTSRDELAAIIVAQGNNIPSWHSDMGD